MYVVVMLATALFFSTPHRTSGALPPPRDAPPSSDTPFEKPPEENVATTHRTVELFTGVSGILYNHALGFITDYAWEVGVTLPLHRHVSGTIGGRLGLGPLLPEIFARLGFGPAIGCWRPVVGVELGVTGRGSFPKGDLFAREVRTTLEAEITPVFIAFHAAPIRFFFARNWHITVSAFRIGMHLSPPGKFCRLEWGLIELGYSP